MLIKRDISRLIVFSEDDIVKALAKISENRLGFVLCVSEAGRLEGVLTDGDVRRWLTTTDAFDLSRPVIEIANREFLSLLDGTPPEIIASHFSDRITFIPLVDDQRHLRAVAHRDGGAITIGERMIEEGQPAYLIAEIGNNHNGSLELAKRLIDLAAEAGADCAKFQMRSMATLYRNSGDAGDASADLGAQYTLDLLSRFQLSDDEMFSAFDHCRKRGIEPLCTPWDPESLAKLETYGMRAYKLASADLTNHDLLSAAGATGKTLILSTGMSFEDEIVAAVGLLKQHRAPFVLLHCNSAYPAPFKDINLAYLKRLKELSGGPVGYSGHERGFAVAVAAVARGAVVVEKHFTIDRNLEGNDHRISLLPNEFAQMAKAIREVEESIGENSERRLTQGELMNREVLAKSLVAARPIARGEVIEGSMIAIRSPGQGLQPYHRAGLIGRKAKRDFTEGDFFYPSDIDKGEHVARSFAFRRPFGLPVRWHDLHHMAGASNLDLVEFHLSYKDMEQNPGDHIRDEGFDLDLVVHSPELFAGDHIMDLCAADPDYRQRSIDELNRVTDLTRRLAGYFDRARRPMIIINAGGFSLDAALPRSERETMYEMIAAALTQVDQTDVEIIPQTMPPFPWHFGGQRYHNLFLSAEDITAFHDAYGYRVCLDISHSALACSHEGASFRSFLEAVGPITGHLHIVDAKGVDGEGLQIGDGTIDFAMVAEVLDRTAPNASFIPEIWQGHKNSGAGFWEALSKLEAWF